MTVKTFQNKLSQYNAKHSNSDVFLVMLTLTGHVFCFLLTDGKRPNSWYCTRLSSYPHRSYVQGSKNIPKEVEDLWNKFCFTPRKDWNVTYSKQNGWVTK